MIKPFLILAIFLTTYFNSNGQSSRYLGSVYDEYTGNPIVNVNIQVIGTVFGTTTDQDGQFDLITYERMIRISHVAYQSKQIKLDTLFYKATIPLSRSRLRLNTIDLKGKIVVPILQSHKYDSIRNVGINLGSGTVSSAASLDTEPMYIVESPAEFPGGLEELYNYYINSIAAKKSLLNKSFYGAVSFTVNTEGRSEVDSIFLIPERFHESIKQVIEGTPKWIPAFQRFKPQETYWMLPIIYDRRVKFVMQLKN